ncbi:MAG: hypothetical protein LBK28_08855, partial [Propionibacteriaceae bacterium]|nr:hypothetical protein [Propionibacteriaceae bacterium]
MRAVHSRLLNGGGRAVAVLALLCWLMLALAPVARADVNRVFDEYDLLTAAEEAELNARLSDISS